MPVKGLFPASPMREPMPKTPFEQPGFAAMAKALAGRKKNKPMKPPKVRPMQQPDFVKRAM